MEGIISVINKVIYAIGTAIAKVLELLPNSPFLWLENIDNIVLNAINWVIPVNAMVLHLQVYVIAVAMYYALRIVLRWLKAAGG